MAVDIDQSYYRSGTATVLNGGTVVTGQGTQWVSSSRANDLFGTHTGDGVRILSIDSDTQLTLAYPWSGPDQTSSDYEIQFTPYDTGYYPAVRQLLQTMASGNIDALAGLNGAPNMLPMFTGAGAMSLVSINDVGIQDPNQSLAKLAALLSVSNLEELASLDSVENLELLADLPNVNNLGAVAGWTIEQMAAAENAVSFTAQTLTNLQKSQARANIGATLAGFELIAADTNNSEVAAWVKTGLGTDYREISLFIDAMPVTAGGSLNVQVSEDNGVTWLTAAADYTEQALVASGTTVTAVQPQSPGIGSGATGSVAGGGGAIMEIKISEFNQYRRSLYSAFITRRAQGGGLELVTRNGLIRPWSPFNAIRLTCSNGNLARFRVLLMGAK